MSNHGVYTINTNFSEKRNELDVAFAKARAEMPTPKLDAFNPYFKSKFATLKEVVKCTVPVLAKHGITVYQDLRSIDGMVEVFTTLAHSSGGERSFGPFAVPATKKDPQGYGAAASYARRYHLLAVCGIVGDLDDDAESISSHEEDKPLFKSNQTRTKYVKGLRDAAANNDAGGVRELWEELDSEQRLDVWKDLSSIARSTIKSLLKSTSEVNDGEEI